MTSRSGPDKMQSRFVIVFLILALVIGLSGYVYYNFQKQQLTLHIQNELSAIADLKVDQITAWRKERLEDAMSIVKNPFIASAVRQFLQNPSAAGLEQDILLWMTSIQKIANYQNVILVDTRGKTRLSTSPDDNTVGSHAKLMVQEAVRSGRSILSDFHRVPAVPHVHLDLVAPISIKKGEENSPIAALVIRIHPETFLYPLIQSWPGTSTSAETLLVRKDGDTVLFLNELRHRKETVLSLRIPLDKKQLPSAMAIQGVSGVLEGIDYRDVPVLAATRSIPKTPWFLVAKVDLEEIYAPVRRQAQTMSIVVAGLILCAGLIVILWWRKETAEQREKYYEAELARKSLSRQYDYLSKYANDIILFVAPTGGIRDANDRALQAYGYTRDELLRLSIRDLRAPETLHEVDVQMQQVREQKGFVFETIHKRKDGATFPVEVSSRVIDEGGGSYFQSIIRDISERKQAEHSLMESEQRFKHLIESVTDYIYSVEVRDGRVVGTFHGPGCFKVTGYTSEEYRSDPGLWYRMVLDKDQADVISQSNTILGKEPVGPFEHRIIHKDGSVRWVRNTTVRRYDREGRLIGYDGLISDVTQIKLLENQLRQAQKMEAVGQLSGGIAHDFNNILTAIIGFANLLLLKIPEHDVARTFVEHILNSAERAAHLTHSLLAFSRQQIIELKPVDLNEIIKRVEKILGRVIGEDIEFKTRLAAQEMCVMADSIQIEQVLMNLSANARDAMPNGGILQIETTPMELREDYIRSHSYVKPGKYARITVTDTGVGMDEKTRDRIFVPFFTTKEVGKGTGLGLSMVYGIIKQHNGYINVYSEPGEGTTFKIYLPLFPTVPEEINVKKTVTAERGSETVLLAEDDAMVRALSRNVLEGSGYTVVEAVDGADAVRKFLENKDAIDLLVLDIIMPRKNGKDAYQEIIKTRPDIKVLFTSGYPTEIIYQKGILDTGLDFILKPITPVDFLNKVREVLDRI